MRRAPRIPPAALLLALCLVACDGSGRACELARIQLAKGEYDRAEACLADARGAEVESVRALIDRRRQDLAQIEERIAELRAQLDTTSADAVREELSWRLEIEQDPAARRALEQALSDFTDLFAERARPGFSMTTLGQAGSQQAGVVDAVELSKRDRVLAGLQQDLGLALDESDWSRAWRRLQALAKYAELEPAEFELWRAELLADASLEAEELLLRAEALEREGSPDDALTFLEQQYLRFPELPEFAFFHAPVTELTLRVRRARATAPEQPAASGAGSNLTAAERARVVGYFVKLEQSARVAAWPALRAHPDRSVPEAALAGCVEQASAVLLASPLLEDLAHLANLRWTLDQQRAEALALILDEQTYFYPHEPPDPPRTRTEYVRAQRLVDAGVDPLRATWRQGFAVELPAELAAASGELHWALEQDYGADRELVWPPALPRYLRALPAEAGPLTVQEFAWTPEEAAALELGRAVRGLNTRAIEQAREGLPGLGLAGIPDADERELIRLLNDYRAMFGRSILAWDPRLQVASQGHSDYMRAQGVLGHVEQDPARRQVADRAALAGYGDVTGENCAHQRLGPRAVFTLWVHSSGHHRNLLHEAYREVGTARTEDWWTQVLGYGSEYREALKR